MQELFDAVKSEEADSNEVSGVRTCKINSARFGVPWPRTVEVLEGIVVEDGWKGDVEVWDMA